jgi:hypothetical protein
MPKIANLAKTLLDVSKSWTEPPSKIFAQASEGGYHALP